MATWRAKCWLGSSNGFQYLEVQSNTFNGARQQLINIYGAQQVINLHQVSGNNGMITDDMPDGSAYAVLFENIFKLIGMFAKALVMLVMHAVRKYKENSRTGR